MHRAAVFLIAFDGDGSVTARRYVTIKGVLSWLHLHAGHSMRCDLYDESPGRGGRRMGSLVRSEAGWCDADELLQLEPSWHRRPPDGYA